MGIHSLKRDKFCYQKKSYPIKDHLFRVDQNKIRIYATAFPYLFSVFDVTEKRLSHWSHCHPNASWKEKCFLQVLLVT